MTLPNILRLIIKIYIFLLAKSQVIYMLLIINTYGFSVIIVTNSNNGFLFKFIGISI